MPVVSVPQLKRHLSRGQRLIGLDIGSKTVGLALSDPTLTIASAFQVLERSRLTEDLQRLARVCVTHDVGGIVAGLPISMDGSQGPQCRRVRQFARDLLGVIDLPLSFWDERLSTAAVERVLIEDADLSRQKRSRVIDRAAATYILQGALDAMANASAVSDDND